MSLRRNNILIAEGVSSKTLEYHINDVTTNLEIHTEHFNKDGESLLNEIKEILRMYRFLPSNLSINIPGLEEIKEKDTHRFFLSLKPFFNLTMLDFNFSSWKFSVFEDYNIFLQYISDSIGYFPSLKSLKLNLSNIKY